MVFFFTVFTYANGLECHSLPLEMTESPKRISVHKEVSFKISREEKGCHERQIKFICLSLFSAFSRSLSSVQLHSLHNFGWAILSKI